MDTKKVIIGMLTESTGSHFLDSGGMNGHHWQHNQKLGKGIKAWESRPNVFLHVGRGEFWPILDLYHHLTDNLEFDQELDDKFREFDSTFENGDSTWEKSIEAFAAANPDIEFSNSEYTYNFENSLSQDIVYTRYDDGNNPEGIVLMIHNGCDARGGFTSPRFFKIVNDDFWDFTGRMIVLSCDNGHRWFNDDNEWTNDDSLPSLKDMQCLDYDELSDDQQNDFDKSGIVTESPEVRFAYDGQITMPGYDVRLVKPAEAQIIITRDDKLYCPVCGKELQAYG